MEIFKLVVSYSENLVSITTSEPMTFFNISSPGDLGRRFAKFIVNIWQRHNEYVPLDIFIYLFFIFLFFYLFTPQNGEQYIKTSRYTCQ